MRTLITNEKFQSVTRPLIGLPISQTWRGAGTAIFFELGVLSDWRIRRDGSVSTMGEATIDLEVGWRVEKHKSIYFGSDSGDQRISNCLKKLEGRFVEQVTVQGRLPELVVQLSGGFWLVSCTTWEGQPEWSLSFNKTKIDRQWFYSRRGRIGTG